MKRKLSTMDRAGIALLALFPFITYGQQNTPYSAGSFDAPVIHDDRFGYGDSPRYDDAMRPDYGLPGVAGKETPGRPPSTRYPGGGSPSAVQGAGGGRSTAESFLLFQKMLDAPVSAVGGSTVGHDSSGRVTRLGDAPVDYSRSGRVTRFAGESVEYDSSGRIVRFGGEIVHHDSSGRPVMVGRERLGYDSSGRLIFIGSNRVDYDRSGRIVRIGDKPLIYDTQDRLKAYGGKQIEYRRDSAPAIWPSDVSPLPGLESTTTGAGR